MRGEKAIKDFQKTIWDHHKNNRRDLPWRRTKDPYKILVSEIMLQQTQVDRVIPKYKEFLKKFPTFRALSRGTQAQVLKVWQGLGYNRRALYLTRIAEKVEIDFKGKLPHDPDVLIQFPGIGRNTAGAICAFAFNTPTPFIETNIRSVYIYHFCKNHKAVDDKIILDLIEKTLPKKDVREWYYALMDYGSALKKKGVNPNRKSKHYRTQSRFEGSQRQSRGKIIASILEKNQVRTSYLQRTTGMQKKKLESLLKTLEREGFLRSQSGVISLR